VIFRVATIAGGGQINAPSGGRENEKKAKNKQA